MGADPLEAGREIRVPSREREVAIGTFSAGETWSFSAAGEWSTGFVHCGPGGYRNPDTSTPTPALAVNDVFAPLFGLFAGMSAHESYPAREMKLTGQPKVEAADPYVSRMTGGDFDYAALARCKGKIDAGGQLKDYDPPIDWTLSGEAKRYIENSVIATTPACNAKANVETIDAIVDRLGR